MGLIAVRGGISRCIDGHCFEIRYECGDRTEITVLYTDQEAASMAAAYLRALIHARVPCKYWRRAVEESIRYISNKLKQSQGHPQSKAGDKE